MSDAMLMRYTDSEFILWVEFHMRERVEWELARIIGRKPRPQRFDRADAN
jgi:hypothetical protein